MSRTSVSFTLGRNLKNSVRGATCPTRQSNQTLESTSNNWRKHILFQHSRNINAKINHILGQNSSLSDTDRRNSTSMFSSHKAIKLEIRNTRIILISSLKINGMMIY